MAPLVGVMLTLVAWGSVVDRYGERFALLIGLVSTTIASGLSTQADGTLALGGCLFLAGAAGASTASASGRVVAGWFPPQRRGLAMGIRQMAQPLGVGIAAVSIATIADASGISAALWVPTAATGIAAVVVFLVVLDPPRPDRSVTEAPNPYRADRFLARVHGVSVLLVIPQAIVWTFSLVWLIEERGWSPGAAGSLIAGAQVLAALGRILAGALSDWMRSRMRPLVWVTVAAAGTMGGLAISDALDWSAAVAFLVLANVVTVADNGLAFTAVAERAGPFWSGRALGVQNTAQFLAGAAMPPLAGLVATEWGYAAMFGLCVVFPVLALPLVPVHEERELT
jgi:sugar phosphate permease